MHDIKDFINNNNRSFSLPLNQIEKFAAYIKEIDSFAKQNGIVICYEKDFDYFKPLITKTSKVRHEGTLFDTSYFKWDKESGVFVVALNKSGDYIASTAAKNFQWKPGQTLDNMFPTLPPFFIDPADFMTPDKTYFCNTFNHSHIITGNHVYCGATWVRDDYRHLLLSMIIPRLTKVIAQCLWNQTVTWGIVGQSNFEKGFHHQYGLPHSFPIETSFKNGDQLRILNDYIVWSDECDSSQ